jgi:hypothetical protein
VRHALLVLIAASAIAAIANANGAAGLAFDPTGNLFLLGANPSTIFKFSPNGQVTTFAQAKNPGEDWQGIAIDARGNIFVATDATDRKGDVITRILKWTPTGKQSVYVANLGKGQPKTLAIDHDGNLFVGVVSVAKPRGADAIYKVSPNGQRRSVFTTTIEDPTFFALDNAGNLFAYQESRKISKLAPNGSEIVSMITGDVYDLVCDAAGNLIVALPHDKKIEKIAPDGTKAAVATDVEPWFLAIDKVGNIFALDNGIVKFSQDGKKTLFAPNPIN